MGLSAQPDATYGPDDWTAAMRAGDFDRAWEICDRCLDRVRREGLAKHEGARHLQRIWRGEELRGQRVLVRCYHGLGDTLQFARFLLPLRQVASEVTVWCQPELMWLIAGVEGVDRVLPLHDGTPALDFDVDIEIMEIPHALRATRDQFEMRRPYVRASTDRAAQAATNGLLSVGLMWDVGDWDRRRVVPVRLLRQLNQSCVQLCSLQRRGGSDAAAEIGAVDLSTPDIEMLAGRLQGLDLCICPDTMVAHLSAALGCETWVMLHANCDWRWPAFGSTTIWYPAMRLFRQPVADDWHSVVAEIRSALSEKVRHRRSAPESPALARR